VSAADQELAQVAREWVMAELEMGNVFEDADAPYEDRDPRELRRMKRIVVEELITDVKVLKARDEIWDALAAAAHSAGAYLVDRERSAQVMRQPGTEWSKGDHVVANLLRAFVEEERQLREIDNRGLSGQWDVDGAVIRQTLASAMLQAPID
jgi:hypothetical protein